MLLILFIQINFAVCDFLKKFDIPLDDIPVIAEKSEHVFYDTRIKSTASRHAVTDGLAALAYGWSKTVRKCALPCGCLMNIHKIS